MQPIILIAEILWDEYEDGTQLLGGSGLNIAWHMQALGAKSHVVSCVGNDKEGEKFKSVAKAWGISTEFVQTDPRSPTGIVKVVMDEHKKPTYINQDDMAMDHIRFNESLKLFHKSSMVYHGTFMLRNPDTRNTIDALRKMGHPVFMDLNLRSPYWSQELFDKWVRDLAYLKLSDDELGHLSGNPKMSDKEQLIWLQQFGKDKNIENILFTQGPSGSYWIKKDQMYFTHGIKVDVVDTAGAGDAFCAAILFSLHEGLKPQQALEKASAFAAQICTVHGATSHDPKFYKNALELVWNKKGF